MNYSLRPQPLIAQVLPGLFALGVSLFFCRSYYDVETLRKLEGGVLAVLSVAFFLAAWILGVFVDAIRNWGFEWVVSWFGERHDSSKVDWWDFFFQADRDKVEQMHEYYFAYYALDVNFAIASFLLLIFFSSLHLAPTYGQISLSVIGLIFLGDGLSLRKEIKRLALGYLSSRDSGTSDMSALPHEGVYTRLQQSKTHGVGVFAISDIPQGKALFEGDNTATTRVDRDEISNLPSELRRLYTDFCVLKDGKYICPTNFEKLTVAWYVNEARPPATANVRCEAKTLEFFALRDIKAGEELLVDYSSYGDSEGESKDST